MVDQLFGNGLRESPADRLQQHAEQSIWRDDLTIKRSGPAGHSLAVALETNRVNFSQPNELTFLYLVKALKNRIAPQVSIAKYGFANLDSNFRGRDVQVIISKIENAKSEWEIAALEYGRALAVCLAAI